MYIKHKQKHKHSIKNIMNTYTTYYIQLITVLCIVCATMAFTTSTSSRTISIRTPHKVPVDSFYNRYYDQQQNNDKNKLRTGADSALSMGMFDQDDGSELNGTNRLFACLPYLVPLLDGDSFGKYIYMRIPPLKIVEQIFLGPFVRLDETIPFFGFGLFLALVFLSRNTNISRGVRFNMQQALLIDIALIFPDLIGSAMSKNTPMFLIEPATNFVFYAYATSIGYSIISNLSGKTPRGIPVISEAADRAVGPF